MERRFRVRLDELLDDAVVEPAVLRGMLPRLERFLEPFVASLETTERRSHAHHYVSGLASDLRRKNAEGIAYLHDQERRDLQKLVGQVAWAERPLLTELARQVGAELGEPDGVLVFDPSAFPKKGTASVGVQRQWCGRLGKIDNCQVAHYPGCAHRPGPILPRRRQPGRTRSGGLPPVPAPRVGQGRRTPGGGRRAQGGAF